MTSFTPGFADLANNGRSAWSRWLMRPRYLPSTVGWAVRRTWLPRGDHEFVLWRLTKAKALRAAAADAAYWHYGPIRPVLHVVLISLAEFEQHRGRRFCTATDCTLAQRLAGGQR